MKQILVLNGHEYWCTSQIVHHYGINPKTIYLWKDKGLMPGPVKIGRHKFYCREDLEARLAQGEPILAGDDNEFREPEKIDRAE